MSSSTRISLHECTITVSLPPPPPQPPNTTPEQQIHQIPHPPPADRTEAYIGNTLFLLLTLTPPTNSAPSAEILHQAVSAITDLHVHLGRDRTAARVCSLPILTESKWVTIKQLPPSTPSLPSPRSTRLCKGLWVLLRTPPDQQLNLGGRQELFVSLRERQTNSRPSSVWATLDKASRLFGKSITLTVAKPLMVVQPLNISSTVVRAGEGADKQFVCINATNVTPDSLVCVTPPWVNLNASRIVDDPEMRRSTVEFSSTKHDMEGKEASLTLEECYEFVLMLPQSETEDETAEQEPDISADLERSKSTASVDDYGLFIPSFNTLQRRAVTLAPREVYNFVYKVRQKGSSQYNPSSQPTPTDNTLHRRTSSLIPTPSRRLKPGTCLETPLAIAWNCFPLSGDNPPPEPPSFSRELSAGGVLATGRRGNVAVRLVMIHWRPAALLDEVVVAFAGPAVACMGERINIAVSVVNQTDRDLQQAAVLVQQDDSVPELLALRTVVVVGKVPAGTETTLQLPCVALRGGRASLRPVSVVDRAVPIEERVVWTSHAAFEVFVVDPKEKVPGDPDPPAVGEVATG